MATTSKIKITTAFANDDKAQIEFPTFDSDTIVIETLRTAIKNFDASEISDTYISESGSPFASISAAVVTTVEENEINLDI